MMLPLICAQMPMNLVGGGTNIIDMRAICVQIQDEYRRQYPTRRGQLFEENFTKCCSCFGSSCQNKRCNNMWIFLLRNFQCEWWGSTDKVIICIGNKDGQSKIYLCVDEQE